MAERASERLLRLLGMIGYLDRNDGVSVEQLAAHFGISAAQVMADVDTLWMSGTPGYYPHDLIDFDADSYDRGEIRLTEARGMTRPLRLGTREAVTLLAALRAMAADLGPSLDAEQAEVLRSALAKLTAATGDAAGAVDVRLALDGRPDVVSAIRTGLATGRRLRIRYVNASDVTSDREVDPLRLTTSDERSYLQAWCLRAGDERLFRLDRVLAAEVLDTPVARHPGAGRGATAEFRPDPSGDVVTLHLRSTGRWVAETVPVEGVRNLPDGSFEVDVRVAQRAFLRSLLLQAAGDVLAVRPPEVARDVADRARAALAAYGPLAST
ncbi:helix-turn-helix transcriptional regulator [Cellulomonas triticagri]|uniref:WYL domain-containing protein n=1 Tax=Cellulomonas triticagri TaxID=2483352 RepID=A0A3M2IT43_9CELL|nr:WYL domain-containing protein [Cellulomonas triticagri]RMI05107.1 WYL domain-containing protein [Cellulomonas triticagri]